MAAYVINDVTITDPEGFEEYKKLSPASIKLFGGKFLARGGEVITIDGDWSPRRVVILEFPNMAQARAWIDSDEYAPARRQRELTSKSRMVIVEGLEAI